MSIILSVITAPGLGASVDFFLAGRHFFEKVSQQNAKKKGGGGGAVFFRFFSGRYYTGQKSHRNFQT